jgi:hypothetical protein
MAPAAYAGAPGNAPAADGTVTPGHVVTTAIAAEQLRRAAPCRA